MPEKSKGERAAPPSPASLSMSDPAYTGEPSEILDGALRLRPTVAEWYFDNDIREALPFIVLHGGVEGIMGADELVVFLTEEVLLSLLTQMMVSNSIMRANLPNAPWIVKSPEGLAGLQAEINADHDFIQEEKAKILKAAEAVGDVPIDPVKRAQFAHDLINTLYHAATAPQQRQIDPEMITALQAKAPDNAHRMVMHMGPSIEIDLTPKE